MKLMHFAAEPLGALEYRAQAADSMKPAGLWVSDESGDDGWVAWCQGEEFGLDRLEVAHLVTLAPNARVLYLRSGEDIDGFTLKYAVDEQPYLGYRIRWSQVAGEYQGIIITPYVWSRRLTMHTGWYYGWDCASGCIWDPAAVASVKVLDGAR